MRRIKSWLTPPVFEDEVKTQQAYLLHAILWTLICVPIVYLVFIFVKGTNDPNRALAQSAFGEIANVILLMLLRRGHVRAASVLQVSAFWLFFTVTAATGNGVTGEAYLLGYSLVIAIAGMLLGATGASVFTVLSLAAGALMVYGQTNGLLVSRFEGSLLTTWIISLLLFPVGAVLQHLGSRITRESLARARTSEARYRLISQLSSNYTFSTEVDEQGNMRLNWVAGALEKISGYTFDDYVAHGGWLAHLHPDDVEKDRQALEKLKTNQRVIHDIRTFNKDRQVQWVRVYAHPVWDEARKRLTGIVGAVHDIAEQKMAEEYEQRRRDMLEKIIQLGQYVTQVQDIRSTLQRIWCSVRYDLNFDRLGIYIYNAEQNAMDGTYGTNHDGEMLEEWFRHLSLENATKETNAFLQALQQPNGLYLTHHYDEERKLPYGDIMQHVKDFAAVAAWAGEKPVAVLCVDNVLTQRPITNEQLEALRLFAGYAGLAIENARLNDALQNELSQQKQAEEREAQRRAILEKVIILSQQLTEVSDLRTTLEKIWHGVHDTLEFDRLGIFLYNSERNSMDGTLGTNNQGQMVEEWDQWFSLTEVEIFRRAVEKPDSIYFTHNYDSENEFEVGHEMYGVKDFAAVAAWSGEKPVAVICVDNLVTGRVISDEQLEALRLFAGYAGLSIENARLNTALKNELTHRQTLIEQLEAKNAELERFTYTVSHDLKSPLVTITGFLGYLERDALAGETARVKSTVLRITNAAHRMQSLLNDLLELSRIGRLMNPPENIPFKEIVQEAVERVRGRLDQVDAVLEIQGGLPTVHGDRVRLIEVIQNLVDNAAKYSNPQARPRIEIGARSGTGKTHCLLCSG
ncbi:MAG TPA: GAF domain-containing protein [Anaerolineales bacterium]|nr:GAF domain-containing protein [Anaerolineales bacterium]